jgi:hypothetical protein
MSDPRDSVSEGMKLGELAPYLSGSGGVSKLKEYVEVMSLADYLISENYFSPKILKNGLVCALYSELYTCDIMVGIYQHSSENPTGGYAYRYIYANKQQALKALKGWNDGNMIPNKGWLAIRGFREEMGLRPEHYIKACEYGPA